MRRGQWIGRAGFTAYGALFLCAAIVVAAVGWALPVHAQSIYKCPLANGSYAFTDTPCKGAGGKLIQAGPTVGGARAGDIESASTPEQLAAMSLSTMYFRMQALGKRIRELDTQRDHDLDVARMRFAGHPRDEAARAEIAHIRATWQPQIGAMQGEVNRLIDELRRRCPHGSAMNSSHQTCNR